MNRDHLALELYLSMIGSGLTLNRPPRLLAMDAYEYADGFMAERKHQNDQMEIARIKREHQKREAPNRE